MSVEMSCRPLSNFPGPETRNRVKARFLAASGRPTPLSQTLDDLDRELRLLGCRRAVLEMDLQEADIRNDGWPRSKARPATPRVVLSLPASKHGPLRYPCDTFTRWEDNLRAIALALQALRAVDRYGVTRRGEQYTGWKALPASTASSMTAETAALFLARPGEYDTEDVLSDAGVAKQAVRDALWASHPDQHGGSADEFHQVQTARAVLASHHGVSL